MRRSLPLLAATALLAAVLLPATSAAAATDQTQLSRWTTTADYDKGSSSGLTGSAGNLTIAAKKTTPVSYDDPHVAGGAQKFDSGTWTTPWQSTGFAAKSLVPSWNVSASGRTWARVEVRVRSGKTVGSWDTVARWAINTSAVVRSSYSSQTDDLAKVSTDTIVANAGKSFDGYQVRIKLLRPAGTTATPTLQSVKAVAASYLTRTATTSATTMTKAVELAVPRYSQMIHAGQLPQFGGGGEAWCSPTSTSMVMHYFGEGPTKTDYAWSSHAESWVNHAARYTFDQRYDGTGNWPFNTAYAAKYSLDTFVTRMASLRDAEAFIKAGIPVVASVAFGKGQLTGAPISSTPGHLLVIVGFTKTGQVVVNDPAAPKASSVRRVYQRAQLEKAWLRGSGGIAYVIRPPATKLPKDTARW
ncbi:MAG: hypothetical protein JWR27_1121 [Aeromicrobium sp.]|nr:hypothetical protein [Aeromicrobium sp.]